jgi:hypothetical protein
MISYGVILRNMYKRKETQSASKVLKIGVGFRTGERRLGVWGICRFFCRVGDLEGG